VSVAAEQEDLAGPGFRVHLDVFEGPFDLLLSLIAKRHLDVTMVAIAQVTDEFVAHIRQLGEDWELDQASEFLVVAATLLDLKIARLLPSAEVTDEEDLARLEARDLLFARLLQYRAYKEVATLLAQRMAEGARRFPRAVSLEPAFAGLLPQVVIGVDGAGLAAVAAQVEVPRRPPVVDIAHVHAPTVSVQEQAALLAVRLRGTGAATFRSLVADCADMMEVVGRFLALLELYREAAVAFEQVVPLGELHVRWAGERDRDAEFAVDADESYSGPDADESSSGPVGNG
jgi:segregation and condensation protein A